MSLILSLNFCLQDGHSVELSFVDRSVDVGDAVCVVSCTPLFLDEAEGQSSNIIG